MKLKYVGPRPSISAKGVVFKAGKEDKYIYLSYAVDILKAINKIHIDKHYVHPITFTFLSDMEIYDTIKYFESNLDIHIQNEIDSYSKHLDNEIEKIYEKTYLSQLEKEVYIKNLQIMREYRLQRAVNKIIYFHCLQHIIKIIKNQRIKTLDTVFCDKFWHILHSIEGHIVSSKSSLQCEFKVIEEQKSSKMIGRLEFNYPISI